MMMTESELKYRFRMGDIGVMTALSELNLTPKEDIIVTLLASGVTEEEIKKKLTRGEKKLMKKTQQPMIPDIVIKLVKEQIELMETELEAMQKVYAQKELELASLKEYMEAANG